jgi:zinc transporter ZupT
MGRGCGDGARALRDNDEMMGVSTMKRVSLWLRQALLVLPVVCIGLGKAQAQPKPEDFERFKTRIDEAVREIGDHPRWRNISPKHREELAEFVSGNMLFVLLHELAHTAISELDLPVLGKEEDAADSFASLTLIHIKSAFSDRVLTSAAKGWFMADRRDRAEGEPQAYYDEHGLNQQRAFQIVCYMVGADPVRFKDLAKETKLPEDRQETCNQDYQKAAKSWGVVLQPHVRSPGQPETKIDVVYGDAKGKLELSAQIARAIRLLEPVAARSSELVVWPAPFLLEMQSCGFINARWSRAGRKLTLCYELAQDFADLYRGYGMERADSRPRTSQKGKSQKKSRHG